MSERFRIQDATGVIGDYEPIGKFWAYGSAVPTNAQAGFATGCIYQVLGATAGTGRLWINEGSNTSTIWVPFDPAVAPVVLTATTVLAPATHANRPLLLSAVAGFATTVPAATGSGTKYSFIVRTVLTSNTYVFTFPTTTAFGTIICALGGAGGAASAFTSSQSGNTTITLAIATTGALSIGDWLEFTDAATSVWMVRGVVTATTPATAFS